MSSQLQMAAFKRAETGKGVARELRRQSKVPAVIYGDKKAPVLVSLDDKTINLTYLKGHIFTSLCTLDVEGEKHLVLAKDVQLDPVSDRVVHVDFLRVSPKTIVKVMVPVHVTGREENKAMKAGGVLVLPHHELELACPATDIPEEITVDVTNLEMGHSIKLHDVKLPKGTKSTSHHADDLLVVSIHEPTVRLADEQADAATAAAASAASTAATAAAPAKAADKK